MNKRLVIKLRQDLLEQPVLYNLVKKHNLMFNILKASITPQEQGLMVVDLSGNKEDIAKAEKYLYKIGVSVESIDKDVNRIEEKCTHCGACTAVCPTSALKFNTETSEIIFDKEHCVACGLCIKVCPPRAMELKF